MTCSSCHAELPENATFCSRCGAQTSTVAGVTPSGAATATTPQSTGLSQNAAAAIAYLTIIPAIIFLVIEPYNRMKFVRFHAFQCIALSVCSILLHIAAGMIPVIGWTLAPFISLAFLILWIVCILKASKGEWFKVPLIGDFAEGQANK